MTETLIISLVTVVLSAISSMSLVNWRLKSLESKVDKHNSYSDRIAQIEKDIAVIRNDMQYIKERLDDRSNNKAD